MRISIGMCTYQGEAHIAEQLASFVGQTRLPDEVVVCDDRSSDATWAILERFAKTAPFDVRLVRNEQNLGSTANCEKALALCTGDILLPSDQDDVWLPGKLAAIERAFERHPSANVVIGDVVVVGEDLRPLGYTLWELHGYDAERQRRMAENPVRTLLERNHATAGGMAFCAREREVAFPIPRSWIHDGWIALMAAMRGEVVTIPEKMMLYRQHGRNQVGAGDASPGERLRAKLRAFARDERPTFRKDLAYWEVAAQRLAQIGGAPERMAAVHELQARVEHLRARASLPDDRAPRLRPVMAEWRTGRYGRFSGGIASALKDVLR